MNDAAKARLTDVLQATADRVRRHKGRGLGEQDTKATLIEPVIEALGWDVREPDEVRREFRPTGKDNPVDYALKLMRKPSLFVEAKGLGEDLGDRKWIAQVLGYAVVAGVEWCVLTDGDSYRFYNATAAIDADEKLFCKVRLSEDAPSAAAATLALISRDNMRGNLLETLWEAHYVDRRVKEALRAMFGSPDKGLVRLVQRKTTKLTPREIANSIRRLDVRFESPSPLPADAPDARASGPRAKGKAARRAGTAKRGQRGPATNGPRAVGVSLADVIGAGILSSPVPLFRRYRDRDLTATLRPDGSVEFGGTVYRTCSTAAEHARGTVTGRKMNTYGWTFWQYRDGDGKPKELSAARNEYLARTGRTTT